MMNRLGDIQIYRSTGGNDGGSGAGIGDGIFQVIEGGKSENLFGEFSGPEFRRDMIRNTKIEFDLTNIGDTEDFFFYNKKKQFGGEEFGNRHSLSDYMNRLHDDSLYMLKDITDYIEANFAPNFRQKDVVFDSNLYLDIYICQVINHIALQIHPYQWGDLRKQVFYFYTELDFFIKSCDDLLQVPEVIEKIESWIYQGENGGVIGEGLRILKKNKEESVSSESIEVQGFIRRSIRNTIGFFKHGVT